MFGLILFQLKKVDPSSLKQTDQMEILELYISTDQKWKFFYKSVLRLGIQSLRNYQRGFI